MANQFQSISSGAGELMTFYRKPLLDQLNNDVKIYQACEKRSDSWNGTEVKRSLRVRRNQGIGATSDGGNLPSIGRQTTVQATINAKFLYLRFGVTAGMIKSSKNDQGSFVRAWDFELQNGYKDFKTDLNRQLAWTGRGDLALMNAAATASNSIVIKGRESTEPALKFVDVGLVFDIYDSSGNVKATGVTVNSISSGTPSGSTATLTLDQPVTAAADDILVRSGSYNLEVQGMFYALDGATTTVYNVDRSLYLPYQGNVTDGASAQLTLDLMQTAFNAGLQRGNIGTYSAGYLDLVSLRYYNKLLVPDKRYAGMEADGSFGNKGKFNMDFNGVPLVWDKDFPTRIAFMPHEVMKMEELAAMEVADETGSPMIVQTDVDAFECRIRHFTNFFNEQPAACSVLKSYISP